MNNNQQSNIPKNLDNSSLKESFYVNFMSILYQFYAKRPLQIRNLFFEHPPTLQIIGQNDYFTPSITALPPHSITHWYSDHTPGPLLLSLSIDHPVTCLRSLIFHQNNICSSLIFSIPSNKHRWKRWSGQPELLRVCSRTLVRPSSSFYPLIIQLPVGDH